MAERKPLEVITLFEMLAQIAGVKTYKDGIREAIRIAEQARLDRPQPPFGNPRDRADVARWKANNGAVAQIIGDLRRLTLDAPPQPRRKTKRKP